MKLAKLTVIISVALVFSGCLVSSINPLYTSKDLKFNSRLIGVWKDEDAIITFEKRSLEKAYDMTLEDETGKCKMVAHLMQLGEHQFLDLMPESRDTSELGMYSLLHFHKDQPTHSIMRLNLDKDHLTLEVLSWEWAKQMILEGKFDIAHIVAEAGSEDDRESLERVLTSELSPIIITASTRELQKFVIQHVNDVGAFGDSPIELKRVHPRSVEERMIEIKQKLGQTKKEKRKKNGQMISHSIQSITANTAGSLGQRFMTFDLMVETTSEESRDEIIAKEYQIRDALIIYFGACTIQEISTREFMLTARDTVHSIINSIIEGEPVDTVFFTTFLIQ